jgi:hypothetical protein
MTRELFARKCDCCGNGMNEGYVIDGGLEYYCSDTCLHKRYTKEDWQMMYGDGEGDSYYTEWEDPDDMHYESVDGKLSELDW